MIILLAPEKIICSTLREQWSGLRGCDIILFTSKSETNIEYLKEWKGDIFKHIDFFENYANNDTMELKILDYAGQYLISNVIPMTEADVLRVALVKEKLQLAGLTLHEALKFRDKIIMKEIAKNNNVSIPRYKRIKNAIDLLDFIEEVNYPVIVKPILGRGSLNTLLIRDQIYLNTLLCKGFISDTSRYTDLLAEEYITGDIYHIDGLQIENKIKTISVSKYVNNCLDFVNGSYLGSYTLEFANPLRIKLIKFSTYLLTNIYRLDKNSLFHIEVFVDRDNKISLCEIACRLGGNGINEEVKLQQGIDIKVEFIKSECEITQVTMENNKKCYPIAGRLLIPPTEAKLLAIPTECQEFGVIKYQARGQEGKSYKKMTMSNDEIANFLIGSNDEKEICERISYLSGWFYQKTIWGH